jgi:DNA-binding NarL/FixJ family response regulator
MQQAIRLIIADDQQLFLDGVAALLDTCEELEVIGRASSGQTTLELVNQLQPQVLLLDLSMPGMDGLDVLDGLQDHLPQLKVLMLTVHEDISLIKECLQKGALGYILKINGKEELLRAILDVSNNRRYLDPKVLEMFIDRPVALPSNPENASPHPLLLTKREKEVLIQLSEGKTSSQIAEILFISVNTVDTHRKNIIAKLEAQNITDAVRLAMQQGLLE